MNLVGRLKRALKIHSPSQEMQKESAEIAYYAGIFALKYLKTIDGALKKTKRRDNDGN